MSAQEQIKLKQDWQKQMINKAGVLITCANCEAYDRKNDQCAQFKVRPPVDVIVIGCEEWEQAIPF